MLLTLSISFCYEFVKQCIENKRLEVHGSACTCIIKTISSELVIRVFDQVTVILSVVQYYTCTCTTVDMGC